MAYIEMTFRQVITISRCSPQPVQCTYLVLKWHVHMFKIHWIQIHFWKHFAVIIGPVEHPGTGGVIVFVHGKLPTRM